VRVVITENRWKRTLSMMRFVEWLKNTIGMEEPEPEPRFQPPRVRPKPPLRKKPAPEVVDFSADPLGRVEDGGPGKNVLVRNKYVREDTGTDDTLKIVDDTLAEQDDGFGADPYNTGRFDRSKSWDSFRTRK
jgi:hypothetical protein